MDSDVPFGNSFLKKLAYGPLKSVLNPLPGVIGGSNKTLLHPVFYAEPSPPTEMASPVSKIPRLTRIFGGFLKSAATKIEGRVYNTFNNQFCQFKDDLCEPCYQLNQGPIYQMILKIF
jgi:hypothetical protein